MTQGLQCWDAGGNLILDVTDRLTRILGSFSTGIENGSITDINLASGRPWICEIGGMVDTNKITSPLLFTFGTDSITWTFYPQWAFTSRASRTMVYGVF